MIWWKENRKNIFTTFGLVSVLLYIFSALVLRRSISEFMMLAFFYWVMAHITAIEERLDGEED